MSKTSDNPQPLCYVSDKFLIWEGGIREDVCVNEDPLTLHDDGKYYCLFHLPTQDKDVERFLEIVSVRLERVRQRVAEIEQLSEDEQAKAKLSLSYDFRHVWFPSVFNLNEFTFLVAAHFSSATFSGTALFSKTTFSGGAFFRSTIFLGRASFDSAKFSAKTFFDEANFLDVASFGLAEFSARADFTTATFSSDALFTGTHFLGNVALDAVTFSRRAYFIEAVFLSAAYFRSAIFSGDTFFDNAKFSDTSQTSFYNASFAKNTFFDKTAFNGDVIFNSAVFGVDSDVIFRGTKFARDADFQYCTAEGLLRFSDLQLRSRSRFDFQEAAFENASRVSFHTASLRPNWFVNVDSRKFVFTDIFWRNRYWDFRNSNIKNELDALEARDIKDQKKRIFEIAARQLAVNAEENNRYDEAAKFRYMAMETRRLEETKHIRASRLLMWLYKWTSGYGESWGRAALVLIGVLLFFTLAYNSPFATFEAPKDTNGIGVVSSINPTQKMNNSEGMVYSLYVAALQRPEPKPYDTQTRFFVILETIFAPLQAALLALAIRRKFMR